MLISRSFACLIFVAACGGKVDPGLDDAGSDAALHEDASPPPPNGDASPPPPGDCTNLDLVGQPIAMQLVPEEAPPFAATGGALSFGIYQLVSVVEYTGPNGASGTGDSIDARIRLTSMNGGWNVEAVTAIDEQAVQHSAATATPAGDAELLVTPYCPTAGAATATLYTFDGVNLTLRVSDTEEQFTLVTK